MSRHGEVHLLVCSHDCEITVVCFFLRGVRSLLGATGYLVSSVRPLGQGEVGTLRAWPLMVAADTDTSENRVLNVVSAQNTCSLRTAPGGAAIFPGSAGKASERVLEDDLGLFGQRAGHAERRLGSTVSLKAFFF